MIGYAFMGRAHSLAWRHREPGLRRPAAATARRRLRPGRGGRARRRRERFGWAAVETDWRALIARDDVELVDICAPGDLHAPAAIAALAAGKHVLVREAARQHPGRGGGDDGGRRRRLRRRRAGHGGLQLPPRSRARPGPAARRGRAASAPCATSAPSTCRTGSPTRGAPMTWRMQAERAGSGALGDLGAHVVDLARYLTGDEITGVSAVSATFIAATPAALADGSRHRARSRWTTRWCSPRGSPPARWPPSRSPACATGRKNGLRVELNGSAGSLAFDLERLNELEFFDAARRQRQRRVPPHPGHRGRPPLPGRLVAARARARLGAHVHAPGAGPADGDRGRRPAAAVVRRRPGGAAGTRRGRRAAPRQAPWETASLRRASRLPQLHGADPAFHPFHRPVGGPAVRGRSAGSRARGATTAWRSPAGATTSRSTGRCARTATWPGGTRCWTSTA